MSAIGQIIDWINETDRPAWMRHALRLLLKSESLSDTDYDLIFGIARKEAGFKEDIDLDVYGKKVSADGYKVEEFPVVLNKIGPLYNIGLVPDGSELEVLDKGLTVIYGDNGAGKSSYVRVLKNVCLTRGEIPAVIANVFEGEQVRPTAHIEFTIGGHAPGPVEWSPGDDNIPELKSIRVFDTRSAIHYVEKEDALTYKPAGLQLLDGLSFLITHIKSQAQQQINANSDPIELPKFDGETAAGKFVKNLSPNTTKQMLEQHLITDDEEKELTDLPGEMAKLTANSPEKIRSELNARRQRFTALSAHLSDFLCGVSEFHAQQVEEERQNLIALSKAVGDSINETFSDLPVEGVGKQRWKKMWDAAKEFSETEAYPGQPFPAVKNANCPLCIQDIDEETGQRLVGFQTFFEAETQAEQRLAQEAYQRSTQKIQSLTFNREAYKPTIEEVERYLEGFDRSLDQLVVVLESRKDYLTAGLEVDRNDFNFSDIDCACLERLSRLILAISSDLLSINDNDNDLAVLISKKNSRLAELQDKKKLTDNQSLMEKEVRRLKALAAYKRIVAQANIGNVTRLSTKINKIYVTSALEDNFQNELKYFGFNYFSVGTKTRGDYGTQKFRLQLDSEPGIPLGEIASEGEAKCFAISGALAELKTDNRRSGVVFDDPVNSLDHRWTSKVAARLVQESLDRQVIIFTHDIVFLKRICEESEKEESCKLEIKSLDRSRKASGIVRDSPPWDALTTSKRIAVLNSLHQDLQRLSQDGTEQEYNDEAAIFYGRLRETWERLVEEKLLNKVVERFSRVVSTQRLKRLSDIDDADIEKVASAMTKCSKLLEGHDSAAGVYENIPDPDEVKADIEDIKAYVNELSGNRKRS